MPDDDTAVAHLHRLEVIRERAWMLLAAAERGQSEHFVPSPEAVATVAVALADRLRARSRRAQLADAAAAETERPKAARPGVIDDTDPPLANFWHGLRRQQPRALDALAKVLPADDPLARARSGAELAVLHRVLEPAGIAEHAPALAALVETFAVGGFSASRPGEPAIDAPGLRRALAGDSTTPLPDDLTAYLADKACRQRLELLASGLEQDPALFGVEGRLGLVVDRLLANGNTTAPGGGIAAQAVVDVLAPLVDPIVASSVRIGGRIGGDVWRHPLAWAEDRSRELVPFHCLLVAITIDLVEPLLETGRELARLDELPVPASRALASAVLRLGLVRGRHAAIARLRHPPGSDIVVELRALSVALADRLVDRLRAELGRTVHDLPVVRIVEPLAQLARDWREQPGPGIAIAATSF